MNLNTYRDHSHKTSVDNGWWPEEVRNNPFVVPTKLMLAVSEIAEGMEGHRKNLMDDHLPHRPMIEVELADLLHRIFDLSGHLGLDLEGAYWEKDAYNKQRLDHKPEGRAVSGGKAY